MEILDFDRLICLIARKMYKKITFINHALLLISSLTSSALDGIRFTYQPIIIMFLRNFVS